MKNFVNILTDGRKLQGATNSLSVQNLKTVVNKLDRIIENRIQKEQKEQKAAQAKLDKIAEIKKQIKSAGLNIEDLQLLSDPVKKSGGVGKKRAIKYSIKNADGELIKWTGIGRMPKVFAHAIESGKSLDDFKI
ncbi:H-NS family nucleoid-associated regulatory protein [Aliiglaciecola sp. LCG003]|uniref:H-NS histone family protein n=1 Tax=Aliiglaciecola sp. LCG003 TaxID=3053655 RepID=UPI00257402A4|nr:H-NS family nucleoid-associated regulatory protein [Aliiglaciecola sp. LCG003]WJG11056.1 H-NS family nucleoid-associated regulatory protein [Aliiglaciecola sp. LCG003]